MKLENLREIRKEKGYTQVDMARQVGVSITAYQLWENNVSTPNAENMKKLKKVLGV